MKLAAETNPSKFDASVEVHVRLGVDPRQADQNIRATVALPNGTGRTIRVAVFAPEDQHAAAKKAGADVVGDEDFLKQLEKEELNFDVLVATPQYMPKLGKYARVLGPHGLMPNPKSGTVAADVAKAVSEAKAGKVEYRVDKQAIVHLSIGKVIRCRKGTREMRKNSSQAYRAKSQAHSRVTTFSSRLSLRPWVLVSKSKTPTRQYQSNMFHRRTPLIEVRRLLGIRKRRALPASSHRLHPIPAIYPSS